MSLAPNPRLTAHIQSLIAQFTPIFDAWHSGHPGDPPASVRECLHNDLLSIGKQVAALDDRGAKVETRLIAEALALLQDKSSMPFEYVLETFDRSVAASTGGTGGLMMAKVVNAWLDGTPARREAAKQLVAKLLEVVNYFVLYDGNVSSREIAYFDEIEKQFSI